MRPNWDEYFLGMAFVVAKRSDDISTNHGCVLVDSKTKIILSTGYNNTLAGMNLELVDHTRPGKYKFYLHAEENAIMNSAVNLKLHPNPIDAYITGMPCVGVAEKTGCLEKLIQVGVRKIYTVFNGDYTKLCNEESDRHTKFLLAYYGVEINFLYKDSLKWMGEKS